MRLSVVPTGAAVTGLCPTCQRQCVWEREGWRCVVCDAAWRASMKVELKGDTAPTPKPEKPK